MKSNTNAILRAWSAVVWFTAIGTALCESIGPAEQTPVLQSPRDTAVQEMPLVAIPLAEEISQLSNARNSADNRLGLKPSWLYRRIMSPILYWAIRTRNRVAFAKIVAQTYLNVEPQRGENRQIYRNLTCFEITFVQNSFSAPLLCLYILSTMFFQ